MKSNRPHRAIAPFAVLLLLLFGASAADAQRGADEIIEELEGMLESLSGGGSVDPDALVAAELPAVLETSGMRASKPITTRMVTREGALEHIAAVMAEQLPEFRLVPMEFAWKAMGLLEPDASLADEIGRLYGGQAGGFYDPKRGELVLLDDMPALLQAPVVRHELVHALQDQTYGLASWIGDAAEDEDRAAAIQAVLEGHATDVMNRATVASMGLDALLDDPDMREALEGVFDLEGLESSVGSSDGQAEMAASMLPSDAPPILIAQLLFPYLTGATFVAGYREAHPEDPSCSQLYSRPPRTTAEVLDPSLWEAGGIPSIFTRPGAPAPGFEVVWSTSLGRLVAWVLLTKRGDPSAGDPYGARWGVPNRDRLVTVGSGWRGDRVAVLTPTGSKPGTAMPESATVVWVSAWRDEREAKAVAVRLHEAVPSAVIDVRGARVHAVFAAGAANPGPWLDAISHWE